MDPRNLLFVVSVLILIYVAILNAVYTFNLIMAAVIIKVLMIFTSTVLTVIRMLRLMLVILLNWYTRWKS